MSRFGDAAKIGFEEFVKLIKNGDIINSMNNVKKRLEELDEDNIYDEEIYDEDKGEDDI